LQPSIATRSTPRRAPEEAALAPGATPAAAAVGGGGAGAFGGGGSPPGCSNDAQGGSETDVDCGGTDCPACANDRHCLEWNDCQSRFCDTSGGSPGVCAVCWDDGNCTLLGDAWCDLGTAGGTCTARREPGEHCGADNQCATAYCVDAVCCLQAACDAVGDCSICNAPGLEGDCSMAPDEWGCDDGLFCTGADHCESGHCTGHSGDPCAQLQGSNDASCGDGCDDSNDSCGGPETGTGCNDGKYCTVVDSCANGTCVGTGDPCSGNHVCKVAIDQCVYRHSITVDGSLADWTTGAGVGEDFATSTVGYTAYLSWDQSNLYVAMQGPAVASGSWENHLLVYLGTGSGSTTGIVWGPQTATLGFPAGYAFSWQSSGAGELYVGLTWAHSNAWGDGASDFARVDDVVELRIPFSLLGLPSAFDVGVAMIDRANNAPTCGGNPAATTFAGVPHDTFADGCNPAWTQYFHFVLDAAVAPNGWAPLP
jgi:hypothetical protein